MDNDFISINNALPKLNMLCDIKLPSGDIKQSRFIYDTKTHTMFWVDNNYQFSYTDHWRYNKNASEEESKEFFKQWSNKDIER